MATSPIDPSRFRQILEEQRAALQAELADLRIETANTNQTEGYGIKNHPAEDATELFLRERNLAVSNDLRRELDEVERALQRIGAGTYGICEDCGEAINPERIEARPMAVYCIRHQREHERQEHDVA